MRRVFLDANVFFAAVRSATGGSYFVIELAKKKQIEAGTVVHALAEAERNIQEKLGTSALCIHYENLLTAKPVIQSLANLPSALETKLRQVLPEKDIPILAGAILSGARVLVTLDQKHLLKNKKLAVLNLPFAVITPGDFLQKYFP